MRKLFSFTIGILCLGLILTNCSSKSAQKVETSNSDKDQTDKNPELSASGNKYTFQLNPKVGKESKIAVTIDMSIDMETMGQQMNTSQNIEMSTQLKVKSNTPEEITTILKYDFFSMNMDIPYMGKMEYDTRKEKNEGVMAEALDNVFGALIGKETTLIQDHSGKIIRTEGMEALDNLSQSQGSFNIGNLISMSQFPDKPIAIGESWTKKTVSSTSPMMLDSKLTLKRVSDGKVYIEMDADVSSNPNFKGEEETPKVSGKQTGTLVYEKETMWLIEGLINQDLQMTAKQMGMTIPMKVKGEIIMSME